MSSTDGMCCICCEPYNYSTRAPISCIQCDFQYCKTCFKRYISDPNTTLRCMECRAEFDRPSLYTRLGPSFMRTTYRDIREAVLYEIEKAKFPETQEVIEHELELERLHEEYDRLDAKYNEIRHKRIGPLLEFRHSNTVLSVREALDQYLSLRDNVEAVDEQMLEEIAEIREKIDELTAKKNKKVKRTYVLACTAAECKGMLSLETKNADGHYVCSICSTVTCSACKMTVPPASSDTAPHQCDPNVLKTIELVQSTSKPCPSCGVPIHKLSGCMQMFCTNCHACFNWVTMQLNDGRLHNPYHSAWLREIGEHGHELMDVQCGRELNTNIALSLVAAFEQALNMEKGASVKKNRKLPPSFVVSSSKKKNRTELPSEEATFLYESMGMVIHHQEVTIPSLSRNRQEENHDLRVRLILRYMTEIEFKHEIQRRDKAISRRNELLQIVVTFRDSLTDIVWPFIPTRGSKPRSLAEWRVMIDEIRALIKYIDECFMTVKKAYGSSAIHSISSYQNIA